LALHGAVARPVTLWPRGPGVLVVRITTSEKNRHGSPCEPGGSKGGL
jgi:hypothetical protein